MTTLTKDHNNHPARAPLTSRRLHQMRDILSKASAQRDGGDIGYAMSDAVKLIDEVLAGMDAVPDEIDKWQAIDDMRDHDESFRWDSAAGYENGWNACRAAMLQGGTLTNEGTKQAGNSPVTPEGWVMVPSEMTPEQMKSVQLKSELGSYASENLSGAYDLFSEFWSVAIASSPNLDGKK